MMCQCDINMHIITCNKWLTDIGELQNIANSLESLNLSSFCMSGCGSQTGNDF